MVEVTREDERNVLLSGFTSARKSQDLAISEQTKETFDDATQLRLESPNDKPKAF